MTVLYWGYCNMFVCLKTYFDITHGWFKSTNENSITLLHACAVDPLIILVLFNTTKKM